jgi:hypothetical protein
MSMFLAGIVVGFIPGALAGACVVLLFILKDLPEREEV